MSTINNWSKIRGTDKIAMYPQPEKTLGDCLVKFSGDLGDGSTFGAALYDLGDSLRQIGVAKELLENNVKQNFVDPMTYLKHNDLKGIVVSRIHLLLLCWFCVLNFMRQIIICIITFIIIYI